MPLPEFDSSGDLPPGVHRATMAEVLARFGGHTPERQAVSTRLLRIYELAKATGKLDRFLIFGSYVTHKPNPNDVDVFLVMAPDFNVEDSVGATRSVFSHARAEIELGASVFWASRSVSQAALHNLIEGWQEKRDKTRRGIVEVIG
jgi:hypothetical protein